MSDKSDFDEKKPVWDQYQKAVTDYNGKKAVYDDSEESWVDTQAQEEIHDVDGKWPPFDMMGVGDWAHVPKVRGGHEYRPVVRKG